MLGHGTGRRLRQAALPSCRGEMPAMRDSACPPWSSCPVEVPASDGWLTPVTIPGDAAAPQRVAGSLIDLSPWHALIWVPQPFRLASTGEVQFSCESLGLELSVSAQTVRIRHVQDGWLLDVAFEPPLPDDLLRAEMGRDPLQAPTADRSPLAVGVRWPDGDAATVAELAEVTFSGFCLRLPPEAAKADRPLGATIEVQVPKRLATLGAQVVWRAATPCGWVYGCQGADIAQIAEFSPAKATRRETAIRAAAEPASTAAIGGRVWAVLLVGSLALATWRLYALLTC